MHGKRKHRYKAKYPGGKGRPPTLKLRRAWLLAQAPADALEQLELMVDQGAPLVDNQLEESKERER